MLDIIFLMLDIAAWCAPRSFCTIHKEQTNIGVLQTTCHGLFLALCLTSPRIGVLKSLSSSSFCLLESDSLGVANSGNGSLKCHVEVQVQSLAELFVSQTNHYPVSDEYPSQFPKVASVGQLMKIHYELLRHSQLFFSHVELFSLNNVSTKDKAVLKPTLDRLVVLPGLHVLHFFAGQM